MLQPLLQEYLIENGSLPLPTAGRLAIQSASASLTGTGKTLIAPLNKIAFLDTLPTEGELQQLTAFTACKLSISNAESKQLLENELSVNAKNAADSERLNWPEWNLFQDKKDDLNEHDVTLNDYLPSLGIEKVYRQPVTVAEPVILPTEIISEIPYPEYEEPVAKDYWWVWAIAIFIISILLILFR